MTFRKKLKKLMAEQRLSYRDVVEYVGLSSTSIVANWLHPSDPGEPKLSQARKLAELLRVPLDYLADDSLDEPRSEFSDDERHILQVVRSLGPGKALCRLLLLTPDEGGAEHD